MAKFEKRTVDSLPPPTSVTTFEAAQTIEPYVWDISKRAKQDPFFAVPSIFVDAPRIELMSDDDTKVSITF